MRYANWAFIKGRVELMGVPCAQAAIDLASDNRWNIRYAKTKLDNTPFLPKRFAT